MKVIKNVADIPEYRVYMNKLSQPPKTFEELSKTLQIGGLFDWLVEQKIG